MTAMQQIGRVLEEGKRKGKGVYKLGTVCWPKKKEKKKKPQETEDNEMHLYVKKFLLTRLMAF